MARTIAPKATMYGGTRFRSRLEARWAAYFDGIGLAWEYEPKTFLFKGRDGEPIYYTPDFWLPTITTWVEVKPVPFSTLDEENDTLPFSEFQKIMLFDEHPETRHPNRFYVTNGPPNYNKMIQGRQFYGYHGSDRWYDPLDIICGPCVVCKKPQLTIWRFDCPSKHGQVQFDGRAIMALCSQVKDMKFEDARD